jgi:hypothetical protein
MPAKCSLLGSDACAALIGLDSIVRVSALPRRRIRRRLDRYARQPYFKSCVEWLFREWMQTPTEDRWAVRKGVTSGRSVLPLISRRSKASWLASLREALCQEWAIQISAARSWRASAGRHGPLQPIVSPAPAYARPQSFQAATASPQDAVGRGCTDSAPSSAPTPRRSPRTRRSG